MGSGLSKAKKTNNVPKSTTWRTLPTKTDYLNSISANMNVSPAEAELLVLLSEPLGQKHLGSYSKKIFTEESFYCWVEIQEFRAVPSQTYRRCIARHIYEKYIKPSAKMALGGLNEKTIKDIQGRLELAKGDPSILADDFFVSIEKMSIIDMCKNTLKQFKEAPEYQDYQNEVKETYNKVTMDDFVYHEKLSDLDVGMIMHVSKKSTQREYVMKVFHKAELAKKHEKNPAGVQAEKNICQASQHPYIIQLHYAFQTEVFAFLVFEYVRGDNLKQILDTRLQTEKIAGLPEDHVVFFAAEIALALNYLHELGIVYYGLRPTNIRINEQGHIKLVDLGHADGQTTLDVDQLRRLSAVIMDNEAKISASRTASLVSGEPVSNDELIAKFSKAPKTQRSVQMSPSTLLDNDAPEIVLSINNSESVCAVNHAIDFWGLGITLYTLLCGHHPFPTLTKLLQSAKDNQDLSTSSTDTLYPALQFPSTISASAKDMITKLLRIDPNDRIGCTNEGFYSIMEHDFFKTIDWDKLMINHLSPIYRPPLPSYTIPSKSEPFAAFEEPTWNTVPPEETQAYFKGWEYVSPGTVKSELGLSKDISDSDIPYKVLQLTGHSK